MLLVCMSGPRKFMLQTGQKSHHNTVRTSIQYFNIDMSLLSIIRHLPTTMTSTIIPSLSAFQQRSIWTEVVRQIPSEDPQRAGQMTFEDVDVADMRIARALRAEGSYNHWLSQ